MRLKRAAEKDDIQPFTPQFHLNLAYFEEVEAQVLYKLSVLSALVSECAERFMIA